MDSCDEAEAQLPDSCKLMPGQIQQEMHDSQIRESQISVNHNTQSMPELPQGSANSFDSFLYLPHSLNRIKIRPAAVSEDEFDPDTQLDQDEASSSSSLSLLKGNKTEGCTHLAPSKHQRQDSLPNLQSSGRNAFQGESLDEKKDQSAESIANYVITEHQHSEDDCEEKKVLFHILPLEDTYNREYYSQNLSQILHGSQDTSLEKSVCLHDVRETSTKKNKCRNAKSFSHEIGRGSHIESLPRPRSDTNLEELLGALRVRFDTAKTKVDSELGMFAADLIEILDSSTDLLHTWKQKIEDLLILARQCATMTANEFQSQCKNIVQELDDKRHEVPIGLLKQLYTHMLFILTRFTRLVQFDNEARTQEDRCFQKIKQCLREVPSFESIWVEKRGKLEFNNNERFKPNSLLNQQSLDHQADKQTFDTKGLQNAIDIGPFKVNKESMLSACKLISSVQEEKTTYTNLEEFICRICEEKVPVAHLESHSMLCALADACDGSGLSLDEKLANMADVLERMCEAGNKHDFLKYIKWYLHDGSNTSSPRFNDLHGKLSDVKSVASPSAGSLTPSSSITTPRTSQLESLWTEYSMCIEPEELEQIHHLADIARYVAHINPLDHEAQNFLNDCIHDVHNILASSNNEALAVGVFGRRLEGLIREKDILVYKTSYHQKSIMEANFYDGDAILDDADFYDLRARPSHPLYKDRTKIDDFEILKPVSRGAFGRVFLARKKTTGDLFAIKVLRKADIIRKNAVENILAERDILISLCNPFVVRFFYSFTCKENLYLVMEYLNGGDLFSLLRNVGCLDEAVARVYIAELVLALEYLHSIGVVHRDLKPDNILIAQDGHIKLTDFGLSKVGIIDSTGDFSNPSANGGILPDLDIQDDFLSSGTHPMARHDSRPAAGTPDYLAPEILLGREHGGSADWWSVGIILFECLTGIPPFNAEHPQAVFDNILNGDIPWPSSDVMSSEARDLIDKLLIHDPSKRLGAKGAFEVKAHPFFQEINWDTLSMQRAVFVPNPESVDDTGYFTVRPLNNEKDLLGAHICSEDCSSFGSSLSASDDMRRLDDEYYDDCVDLVHLSKPLRKRSFNNFSYKNLTQLASMNYDVVSHSTKDHSTANP